MCFPSSDDAYAAWDIKDKTQQKREKYNINWQNANCHIEKCG